jgi:hypothetical protein
LALRQLIQQVARVRTLLQRGEAPCLLGRPGEQGRELLELLDIAPPGNPKNRSSDSTL